MLTERQRELEPLLEGPQRHTLLYGGSRSGKTTLIVRSIVKRALMAPGTRHAILRFKGNAVRSSVWLDTLPKVRRLCFPSAQFEDHRQDGYVSIHPGGSQIWLGGLDEKDRVEKILGQEYSSIFFNECSQIPYTSVLTGLTRLAQTHPSIRQRAYYDLNPVGTRHYTYQLFVQHRDPGTGNEIANPGAYAFAFMNPDDNRANLDPEYLASLDAMPDRQRIRFALGEYQTQIDGALWSFEAIDNARCRPEDVPKNLVRCVVAVDPSGTQGKDEDSRSDDVGIVVGARGDDGRAYLLADRTCNLPPEGWARVVKQAYYEFGADHVTAEANFGGDMVRATIHGADANIPVNVVKAPGQRGKIVRAEPVSALYGAERGGVWANDRVRHAGEFRELEDQLLNFSTMGYLGDRSPDRADAWIWAATELLVEPEPFEGLMNWYRDEAARINGTGPGPAPPRGPLSSGGALSNGADEAAPARAATVQFLFTTPSAMFQAGSGRRYQANEQGEIKCGDEEDRADLLRCGCKAAPLG